MAGGDPESRNCKRYDKGCMKHPKFSHAFEVVADLPPTLAALNKLSRNFRWTWHHETRDLFRSIDKQLWDECEHNPVRFLSRVSRERMERIEGDAQFLARLQQAEKNLDDYLGATTWYGEQKLPETTFAYFCFEFGITEGLPIYSGGLGVLAGDHLKAASDLGLPLVGVGLLYSRGYFRQSLDHNGWQQEFYPQYDFYQMPLELMRGEDDQPVRIEVEFPDRVVTLQVWKAVVGRIPLYLLDSNVLENQPQDQNTTDTLYGGDEEMRIRQEIILGIGGMKALRAIGIQPSVCHMNEGHAAFLSLERIRQFMQDHGCDFRTARQAIVSGNVFTTHTPVPAGFDLFPPDLLEKYLGRTIADLGIPFSDFLRLGRIDPENQGEAFNMAVLAMANADHVNGVSKLHAGVSRSMFQQRWPEYPEEEIPIEPITNGIHTMTWIGRSMANLFNEYLGDEWRRNPQNPSAWAGVWDIPDNDLWAAQEDQRGSLVRFVRRRMLRVMEWQTSGKSDRGVVGQVLDPRILTIGFARRFATYKRATLMLSDKQRLINLLTHPERPMQIIIAGKSHPRDDGGNALIQELVKFINESGMRHRMVFLEDYDMGVARSMVQGVDLWLNNPRRPMEASGTSGMKVVPNGGLNCSILDGWWDEAYSAEVGYRIGERAEYSDQGHQDWLDSRALYQLLENDIAPKFYHRVDDGLPTEWLAMIKRSIQQLAPEFSTARMVQDYASKFYIPAAESYRNLVANDLAKAREALDWRNRIQANWAQVAIVSVSDQSAKRNAIGKQFEVQARVQLGDLNPAEVSVQAIVGKIGPNRDIVDTDTVELANTGRDESGYIYSGQLSCDHQGYCGYTLRVIPKNDAINVRSELNLVTWEQE